MARERRIAKKGHPGVYWCPESDRWWVQTTKRDARGRRKTHGRYLDGTMPLAQVALERAKLGVELGETIAQAAATNTPAATRKGTLSAYAELWLARKAKRLRASVSEHYVDVIGRRLLPQLGHVRVGDVTRGHVEEWVAWAESCRCRFKRAYSEATLHSWYRVVCTFLRDAAAEAGIADPTERIRPPRSKVRNVREGATLTAEQLAQLVAAVQREHPGWYAEAFVMAYTGMRPGELYALRWEDVDEKAGVIHVGRAHWRGHEDATKTDDPRDVALTDRLREVLRDHRATHLRDQHPGLKQGLVFPASDGGFRGTEALQKVLRLAGAAAGIPTRVSPQVLRRTFNTLMIEAGVNETILRSQMGHVSQRMTRKYAGIHPESKRSAVDRLHSRVDDER